MIRLGMQRYAEFEHPSIEVGHPIRPHVAYRIDASSFDRQRSGPAGHGHPSRAGRRSSSGNS
jgi:hypothetical protein